MRRAGVGAVALLAVLSGCGEDTPTGPPSVQVTVGPQDISAEPTQYCTDGERQQYSSVTPPIIEISPDSPITLTVPDAVAEQGWSVQVFDDQLQEKLGEVEVDAGAARYDVNSSDVVPAAFYLVVVEDKGTDCGEFSGAWPIGFIRPG